MQNADASIMAASAPILARINLADGVVSDDYLIDTASSDIVGLEI